MKIEDLGLIPIKNFAIVEDKLYRSSQPMYFRDFQWLTEVIKVERIISLRAEIDMDSHFVRTLPIESVRIPVIEDQPPTEEQVEEFITYLQDGKSTLFHCRHGHGRTSLFCVLARMQKGWSLNDAIKEEEERFKYTFRHPKQLEWLKNRYESTPQLI